MFLLSIFRALLIATFHEKILSTSTSNDFLATFFMGLRFDTHSIMLFLILPFLANLFIYTPQRDVIVEKTRLFFSYFFLVITLLFSIITIPYFKEYNNQFNYFIFEGLYDDKIAIAQTIMQAYHPFVSLFIFILLLYITIAITKKLNTFSAPKVLLTTQNWYAKIIISLFILLFMLIAVRGSTNHRPAMRKWADISTDPFLNKTIINPIRSAIYAYTDNKKLHTTTQHNPFHAPNDTNLSSLLKRTTKGSHIPLPKHIILVVMESYDSWPLQEKYAALHLSDNLKNFAKKGLHFQYFLPAAQSTMNSLASIISGLPYAGVNISLRKAHNGAEDTSIFKQMKQLGYDTYFFYGGFLSWQNIGNFVKNQGVQHIYAASHAKKTTNKGIWGVNDEELFTLVTDTLKAKQKTFSIIMTTSYHPPFSVDVEKYGYPYHTKEDYPESFKKLDDGSISNKALGHLWFSDYAIGNFVKTFEKIDNTTLFAFTGDHYGRRYFHGKPNLYELSSVPFILYGSNIKKGLIDENNVGNHLDIAPTLIELIAPKDFSYQSFGTPLFFKSKNAITFGYTKALTHHTTFYIPSKNHIESWDGSTHRLIHAKELTLLPKEEIHKQVLKKYFDFMGLSWYATMKKHKRAKNENNDTK